MGISKGNPDTKKKIAETLKSGGQEKKNAQKKQGKKSGKKEKARKSKKSKGWRVRHPAADPKRGGAQKWACRRESEGVRMHLLSKKVFLCSKKVFRRKKVRTRRIGANPEKSDLVNFRGPD